MLTITAQQMKLFDRQAMLRFEREVDAHLRAHFPQRCAAMGDAARLALVRHCLARARQYGFHSERDLVLYTDVAMVLGQQFDQDPSLGWAREILTDRFIVAPALRADLLHERAMTHLAQSAATQARAA